MGIMKKRTVILMMVVMITWQKQCHGWGSETTAEDIAKDAAESVKNMATEAGHDVKEKSASWSGWVSDKFSTGLGNKKDEAEEAAESVKNYAHDKARSLYEKGSEAYDNAGQAKDFASDKAGSVYDNAQNAKRYAYDKAGDAKDMAYDRAGSVYENADQAKDMAYEKAGTAKDMAQDKAGSAYDMAGQAKDMAYDKVGSAYHKAGEGKDDMIKMANEKSEEATERMSYGNYDRFKQSSKNMASDKAQDIKESAGRAMNYGKDKATDAYELGSDAAGNFEETMHKVGERYGAAKDTLAEKAKQAYENTKEKASETAGQYGSYVRDRAAEL